jgi:hypothetical protein
MRFVAALSGGIKVETNRCGSAGLRPERMNSPLEIREVRLRGLQGGLSAGISGSTGCWAASHDVAVDCSRGALMLSPAADPMQIESARPHPPKAAAWIR